MWDATACGYVRRTVGATGTLDVVVTSHVDADHISGVLDLLAEIEMDRADGVATLSIGDLWHNSFAETVDQADGSIAQGLAAILDVAGAKRLAMPDAAMELFGIAQGERLHRSAARIGVPVNAAFDGGTVCPSRLADPTRRYGSLDLTVVGPTSESLAALGEAWRAWIRRHGDRRASTEALANADRSVPNLSSIVLLAEEGGRRVLLTGDARGDHVLDGLAAGGLLDGGSIHLDVLKVQHHGSSRNADRTFFERVRADVHVISANGRHGNPDVETLGWIVETAREQDRPCRILVTHHTPSLDAFTAAYPLDDWNYVLETANGDAHVVEL